MNVYIPPVVLELQQLHHPVLDQPIRYGEVRTQLAQFAKLSFEAWKSGAEVTSSLVSNFHPAYLGKSGADIKGAPLSEEDFLLMVAREHGYTDWESLPPSPTPLSPPFEVAVDIMLLGHGEALKKHLQVFPRLVRQTSVYGHEANLLHYLASNGVEMRRQVVPMNLPEILKILLDYGADKEAKMNVYGGQFTFWELYKTGVHPYDAGLEEGKIRKLLG